MNKNDVMQGAYIRHNATNDVYLVKTDWMAIFKDLHVKLQCVEGNGQRAYLSESTLSEFSPLSNDEAFWYKMKQ